MIITDEGRVLLLIGPSEPATVHVDIMQLEIGDKAVEAAHSPMVKAPIILVGRGEDHVEVTS